MGAEGKNCQSFESSIRESADTWLLQSSCQGDVARSSYAALKRYIGNNIQSTMRREQPRCGENHLLGAGVVWGREIGKSAWPAIPWNPGAGAVDVRRPPSCESVASSSMPIPAAVAVSSTPIPAAVAATEACEPRTDALPLKAVALLRDGTDAPSPILFEKGVLSEGTFGSVYRARDQSSGQELAITISKKTTRLRPSRSCSSIFICRGILMSTRFLTWSSAEASWA